MEVETTATKEVALAPPVDQIPDEFGHYHWELIAAPAGAAGVSPVADLPAITVRPSIRGIYTYERWFIEDGGNQLTCHVVLTATGAVPTAGIQGATTVPVGVPAMFDGSASSSLEQRSLSYEWRLAARPETSNSDVTVVDQPILTIVPDVRGDYDLELRVFDGELWSAPATVTLEAH